MSAEQACLDAIQRAKPFDLFGLNFPLLQACGYEVARHTRGSRIRYDGDTHWQAMPLPLWDLEDALRLLDRKLPGVNFIFGRGRLKPDEPLYGVRLLRGADETIAEGEHDKLHAALCIAILKAKAQWEPGT